VDVAPAAATAAFCFLTCLSGAAIGATIDRFMRRTVFQLRPGNASLDIIPKFGAGQTALMAGLRF